MTHISHSADVRAPRREVSAVRGARLDVVRITALAVNLVLWAGLGQLAYMAIRAL